MSANINTASDPEVVQLTAAVNSLARRVEVLERARAAEQETPDDPRSTEIDAVRLATKALFGGSVAIERGQDPEIGEQYFVVRVNVSGTPEDLAEPYREWHRRIGEWVPGHRSLFRLAVEIDDAK